MNFLRNLALLLVCTASAAHAQTPVVVQIDLEDTIQPVSAGYVKDGLNHAKDVNARAVILRLNTPGGLVDSMREIVEAILSSPVPVITWVGPNGARAASAGFFILLAGDLAVMAPGTSTGAAHPVSLTGQKIDDVMEKKIVNDAAAYIRSYVSKRGRNAQLAELGVTESRSFTAEEALKENLIDAVVSDVPGIIERFKAKQVRRLDDRTATLDLRGATVDVFEMTVRQKILSRVMGGISLVVALFAFNLLPVNWTGAILILLAIGLFVLEATVASHGILALGGIVAMVFGALMLVQGPIPQLRIQLATTVAVAVPLAIITVFLVRLVYLSHKKKSITGPEGMIGEVGVAKTDIQNEGKVLVHGEYWTASSARPIPAGSKVRVVKVQGLKLEVEPL